MRDTRIQSSDRTKAYIVNDGKFLDRKSISIVVLNSEPQHIIVYLERPSTNEFFVILEETSFEDLNKIYKDIIFKLGGLKQFINNSRMRDSYIVIDGQAFAQAIDDYYISHITYGLSINNYLKRLGLEDIEIHE